MSKYEFQPRDLRYVDRTIGNKQMARRRVNKKYKEKIKKKQQYERELAEKEKSDKRFANYKTDDEQFALELMIAKGFVARFMERTKRHLELDGVHGRIERRGQKVLLVIEEMYPMNGRSWMNLQPGRGHRAMLNQEKLRKICQKLGVPYWTEMKAPEMRAVLLILAQMDGIDPKKYWWNKRDWESDWGEV